MDGSNPNGARGFALDDGTSRRRYTRPDAVRFCEDMEAAGLRPYHYRGRFFWERPGVDVNELGKAMSATDVPCQWDGMGLGFVVYPVEPDHGRPPSR